MGSVYVISDYGKLGKRDEALSFQSGSGDERRIFLHRTDRLIILGSVEISASALKLIMRNKVETVFLSKNGRFNGKLEFQEGKNVFLRKRQYDILSDESMQVKLARSIVCGKIKNQITFMQRIGRKNEDSAIEKAIHDAQRNLQDALTCNVIDSLRGYEGYGSRIFFSVFKRNLQPDWAVFGGRSMHPPRDNVNALLSFLYTLLLYRIDSLIEMEGLDPYVGYLHTLGYGKRSLTFDLIEEFRTPICDTLACALFNLGILGIGDFEERVFSPSDDEQPLEQEGAEEGSSDVIDETIQIAGVLLGKPGLQKAAEKFEEKMDTLIIHPSLGEKVSYFMAMAEQVRQFKRVLLSEESTYVPFTVK